MVVALVGVERRWLSLSGRCSAQESTKKGADWYVYVYVCVYVCVVWNEVVLVDKL